MVLAVPATLLRRAGQPFLRVAFLLVVLRLSYHVYYGWPVLGLAVWAFALVTAYWVTGRALPLIVAHSLWDLAVTLGRIGGDAGTAIAGLLQVVLILGTLTLAVLTLIRTIKRRLRHRAALSTLDPG